MTTGTAEAWVAMVRRCDDEILPPHVKAGILSTPGTGRYLIDVLTDPELQDRMAVLHASDLLPLVDTRDVLPELIELLRDEAHAEIATEILIGHGTAVIAPLLPFARRHPDEALGVLAECAAETEHPEVRRLLLQVLARDPFRAAGCIAVFGDATLVPTLQAALHAWRIGRERGPLADQAVFELIDAIRALGGEVSPAGHAKALQVMQNRRQGPQRSFEDTVRLLVTSRRR